MIITISREYASNGILIGRLVADRLGYRLYDHALMDEVARLLDVNPALLNDYQHSFADPVYSMLIEWRSSLNPEAYARYLRLAVAHIAEAGNAVCVGRGAGFAVAAHRALRVRIIAPLELRTAVFLAGNDVSEAEARRTVEARDRERMKFVRAVFHQDINDPHFHDITLNLAQMSPEVAAETITAAAEACATGCTGEGTPGTLPEHLRIMTAAHHHVRPELVERLRQRR